MIGLFKRWRRQAEAPKHCSGEGSDERLVASRLRPRSGQVEPSQRNGGVLEAADDLLAAAERFERATGEGRR